MAPTTNSKRIAGQKRHHHHAGFDEHDEKQQRVDPGAVLGDEGLQVFVDVEDEVNQKKCEFHGAGLSLCATTGLWGLWLWD